jgi:hypothetical protein
MNSDTPSVEKTQARITLEQGIVRLNTFTSQDTACEEFALWRAQMLQTLIVLLGENALSVFEWRVLRFVPASAHDEAHAQLVWKSSQNYARLLLRSVQLKQQKS